MQQLSSHQLKAGRSKGCKRCVVRPQFRIRPYEALFIKVQRSAKRDGHSFALTYHEFLSVIDEKCHYCRADLTWAEHCLAKNGQGYNLDRKDNANGYEISNIVACCKRCNHAKGSRFTYEEWHGMTEYFRRQT
jgi:hypothetical protein